MLKIEFISKACNIKIIVNNSIPVICKKDGLWLNPCTFLYSLRCEIVEGLVPESSGGFFVYFFGFS